MTLVRAQERLDFLGIVLRVHQDHRVLLEDGLVAEGVSLPSACPHQSRVSGHQGIEGARPIALVHLQLRDVHVNAEESANPVATRRRNGDTVGQQPATLIAGVVGKGPPAAERSVWRTR